MAISQYIIKRLLVSLLIVAGVLTITFIIMHIAPGDPASLYIRPEIDAKTVEMIRSRMGLDQPLWRQFISWVSEFVSGNFGLSFSHHQPVCEVLLRAISNTLQLTSVVFIIQLLFGIIIGIITAVKHNTWLDHSISFVLMIVYSVPGFWLALMAILFFSLKLGWFPSSQMQSIFVENGVVPQILDRMHHLILPVMVLSAPFIAYTSRFVRGSLLEVLDQDYIRTARAYGIKTQTILFRYALKNALLPLISFLGLYLPYLLSGAVIIETVFSLPGMGRMTVDAIFAHDFPLILASTFVMAVAVVIGNLLSDILYFVFDPKIRAGALTLD